MYVKSIKKCIFLYTCQYNSLWFRQMYVECQRKLIKIATNNLHCIYNIHECLYAFNVQSNQSFTGKCMWNVGVKAGDSRDFLGQKRFFPFTPENVLIGQDHDGLWMWNEGMVQRIGRTNHDDEMWNEGLVDTFDECKLDPPGPYPDWYKNYIFYKEVSKKLLNVSLNLDSILWFLSTLNIDSLFYDF